MAKLENISLEELHKALDDVEEKKPTQRLMLAILYKQGPSVPMIADWFDMRAETIYRWFSEMEANPLIDAIYDEKRPGRSAKLSDEQRERYLSALHQPPAESGRDESEWTPKLARQYLVDEYGIDYTLRHIRRIMNEADISWQTPRPQSPTADGDECEEGRKNTKNIE